MNKKFRILFNVLSIVFLSILCLFYGYRLLYYYKIEHPKNVKAEIKLYEKLVSTQGIEGMNYGLQKDGNEYYYAAGSNDNYLYYLGRMWRIVDIDKDGNIKLITDEVQTILPYNINDKFDESDINTWLNINDNEYSGIFEKSLKGTVNIVKQNDHVSSLLTKKGYERLGKNSFVIDNNNFWIVDEKSNKILYVNNKGEIKEDNDDYDTYAVKPTIVISNQILYTSGNGTNDNPYIIDNSVKEKITDAYVGEYLNYGGYTFRIIDVNDISVKVALDGYIDTNEYSYSKYDNTFSIREGIGYYLNNEFYNSLANNNYIVNSKYYTGSYSYNDNYSYLNTYLDEVDAKVGLYKIGEFFITSYNEYSTLTPSETSKQTIYVINKNRKLFADLIDSAYKVRPVLSLATDLFIIEGNGTKEKPFEIGR